MKLFTFLALSILTLSFVIPPHGGDEIDSTEDEKKVKDAVVKWANATFLSHENYKFEDFHVQWAEEYEISFMRIHAYEDMLTELEEDKKAGKYKGSDEDYEKEHSDLQTKLAEIKENANTITKRADYFQISFWSNVQTNDGITVYYEFICKLDNDYVVYEALINSSIGQKSDKTEIVYKKGVDHSMVKKKSEVNDSDGGSTELITDPPNNSGDGSISITTNTEEPEFDEEVQDGEYDGKKKEKIRKKKERKERKKEKKEKKKK